MQDLAGVADAAGLEAYRIRYLGTKGELKGLMGLMGQVPKELKRDFGQAANALKGQLQSAFDERSATVQAGAGDQAAGPLVDVTEPGIDPGLGRRHVISQMIDQITDVFARMGFAIATGPEVEDERHNFEALNIPATHPARDPLDNFYLSDPRESCVAAVADLDGADSRDGAAASAGAGGVGRSGVSA